MNHMIHSKILSGVRITNALQNATTYRYMLKSTSFPTPGEKFIATPEYKRAIEKVKARLTAEELEKIGPIPPMAPEFVKEYIYAKKMQAFYAIKDGKPDYLKEPFDRITYYFMWCYLIPMSAFCVANIAYHCAVVW